MNDELAKAIKQRDYQNSMRKIEKKQYKNQIRFLQSEKTNLIQTIKDSNYLYKLKYEELIEEFNRCFGEADDS